MDKGCHAVWHTITRATLQKFDYIVKSELLDFGVFPIIAPPPMKLWYNYHDWEPYVILPLSWGAIMGETPFLSQRATRQTPLYTWQC